MWWTASIEEFGPRSEYQTEVWVDVDWLALGITAALVLLLVAWVVVRRRRRAVERDSYEEERPQL